MAVILGGLGVGAVAAIAATGTDHWCTGCTIYRSGDSRGNNVINTNYTVLTGVYCHELDAGTKNIQVGAFNPNFTQYGSWVTYTTSGLRSYAGSYYLRGACANPHSVQYAANAHDNYNY